MVKLRRVLPVAALAASLAVTAMISPVHAQNGLKKAEIHMSRRQLDSITIRPNTPFVVAHYDGGKTKLAQNINSFQYTNLTLSSFTGIDYFPANTETFKFTVKGVKFADLVVPNAKSIIRAIESDSGLVFLASSPSVLPPDDSLFYPICKYLFCAERRMAFAPNLAYSDGGSAIYLTHKGALLFTTSGMGYYFRIAEKMNVDDMWNAEIEYFRTKSAPYADTVKMLGGATVPDEYSFTIALPDGSKYRQTIGSYMLDLDFFSKIPEKVYYSRDYGIQNLPIFQLGPPYNDFNTWTPGNAQHMPLEFWLKMHGLEPK